jgi:hypothetical protein
MPAPANPFPGMNPFLQTRWRDVHLALLGYFRELLSEELPEELSVRAEERVTIAADKEYLPELAIVEDWRGGFPPLWKPEQTNEPAKTVTEPIIVPSDPPPERWLEIRDSEEGLVTVLELLSPWNKTDNGGREYLRKQWDLLSSGVNLVEIDLVRGGQHVLAVDLDAFERPPGAEYLVCVARQQIGYPNRREVYPCSMREPLPTIRVPLRPGDPDVPLALQPLIDRVYRTGRYWKLDHRRKIKPPFRPRDAAWVDERLKAAGLK